MPVYALYANACIFIEFLINVSPKEHFVGDQVSMSYSKWTENKMYVI